MSGDETIRLATVLGSEAARALQAAASLRNRIVDLAAPRWVASGYSGAVLVAVVERSLPPSPPQPRKYVVKVCPADGRRREAARHHAALQMSPPDFADRHLIPMQHDPIALPSGGEILMQNVAGDSLVHCRPMSEHAPAERVRTAAEVVRALTEDWTNEATYRLDELTLAGFLRDGLDGTSAGMDIGLARSLGVAPTLLDLGIEWIETAEDGQHTPLANPLALLDGSGFGVDDRVQFIAGFAHRDLHEDNVLVPSIDGTVVHERFRFVDLLTFDEAAPLSRDLAMLTVSAIVRRLPEYPTSQREALLHYVIDRTAERSSDLPPETRLFIDTVRYAARPPFVPAEFDENWSDQLLLSLLSTALLHLSFENVDSDTRWWLFRLAAHAGTRFLRDRGLVTPGGRRLVDRRAVIFAPVTPDGVDRPPETVATSLPVSDGYRRSLLVVAPGNAQDQEFATAMETVVRSFRAIGYVCTDDDVIAADKAESARDLISARLAQFGPDEAVAVYLTGSVEVLDRGATPTGQRRLVLHTPRSRHGRTRGALLVESMFEGLWERPAGERVRNLLLVLDVECPDAGQVVHETLGMMPTIAETDGTGGMHLLVASRPVGSPATGFAAVWARALTVNDEVSREQPYLELDWLADRIRLAVPHGYAIQVATKSSVGPNRCLPNPRHHLAGVDPREMSSWWEPTAYATSGATGSQWLFSGRRKLNSLVAQWLADPNVPVLVLTGAPGSGKSTVMARAVVATVPDLRERLRGDPSAFRSTETPPEDFRFAATMRLTKHSVEDVRARFSHLVDSGLDSLASPVIAIDGLDEADDPYRVVAEVLRPLIQQARVGGPRLLIATRSRPVGHDPMDVLTPRGDLIEAVVSDGGTVVDIGKAPWLETGDIAEYCDRLLSSPLNDLGRANIYADKPRARRVLARSIETQARHSFLLAAHVARRHTLDITLADSRSPAWRQQFPRRIGDALRQEIEALYGVEEADRQLALLRPLAFSMGAGLTRESAGTADLWVLLATRLDADGREFSHADVARLLEQRVATHLVAGVDAGGVRAYRFHHEALAESFLERGDHGAIHRTVTETLLDTLVIGGSRDWERASTYLRRALPEHARQAGVLESLVDDVRLLMHCDPDRLHEALVSSGTQRLISLSRLFRPYLHQLRAATPSARGFLLSIAATATERHGVADALARAANMPVSVAHVRVRHEALRQSIVEGTPVEALACVESRDGAPLIFIANGRFLDVYDPDSGALVETFLSGFDTITTIVGYIDDDGFPVIAAAGADGGVRLWDATTRALRAENPVDFRRGMVCGHVRSGEVFLAGWSMKHISVWRPGRTDEVLVLPVEWEPGRQPITAAAVVRDCDGTYLLAVAASGHVTFWEPDVGRKRYALDPDLAYNIQLVTLQPDCTDGLLLITTGIFEKEAVLWQSSTGARPWPFPDVPVCVASWAKADSRGIALGFAEGAVDLWDGDERTEPQRLQDTGRTVDAVFIGPADSLKPAIVRIDAVGRIRVWEWGRSRDSTMLTGATARAVAMGALRHGGRYLVVGHNYGAYLWRLDEVSQDPEAIGLHEADAHRIIVDPPSSRIATVGDDGRIHIWSGGSCTVLGTAPIPTGSPSCVVRWREPDGSRIALTSLHLLQVFDFNPSDRPLLQRELSDPGRIAVLERFGRVVLGVTDGHVVHIVDPAVGDIRSLDLPTLTPGGQQLSESARNVVSLCWVAPTSPTPLLVVGTQGGLLARWSWHDDAAPRPLPPLTEDLGSIAVVMPVPGGEGNRLLVGSDTGTLAIYESVSGSVLYDLTQDSARIIGAIVVDSSPPVVVTAHQAENTCGMRVWDPETGRQLRSVVRKSRSRDVYVGAPRAGRTADGQSFIVYKVEDGIELFWPVLPRFDTDPVPLLLPFAVNDVTIVGDAVYAAGGGGFLTFTVGVSPTSCDASCL